MLKRLLVRSSKHLYFSLTALDLLLVCFHFNNGSVKNTFFTLSKSALFSASCFLVHVALNDNELCSPRPSLPWGDEQYCLLYVTSTLLGKAIYKE